MRNVKKLKIKVSNYFTLSQILNLHAPFIICPLKKPDVFLQNQLIKITAGFAVALRRGWLSRKGSLLWFTSSIMPKIVWRHVTDWRMIRRQEIHQYIQSCLAQSSGISVTPTQIFTNVSKLEHSRLNTFDSFRITFKFIGFLGVWFIWFYRVNRRHIDRVRIRLMLISDWFIRVHAGLNQIINSRTGSFWDH